MIIKILIVDDSELILTTLTKIIKEPNLDIQIIFIKAYDGIEAVEKYIQERPDFVFMDIKMPKMDGITAIKKIKEIDYDAKIIVITSLIKEDFFNLAKEAGAIEFLTKPFNIKEIQNIFNKYIKFNWG
jgi:two-component system, chemotaxis family, chemotaxis protein CheY